MIDLIAHWVAEAEHVGMSGTNASVTNPATGEVIANVVLASCDDGDHAISTAAAAWPAWAATSVARHAHSTDGVHFFTRGKAVTSRSTGPSVAHAGGLELSFPSNR